MRRLVVNVEGRRVLVAEHAIERFHERVRAAIGEVQARDELVLLLERHGVWGTRPAWVNLPHDEDGNPVVVGDVYVIAGDVAFPVEVGGRGPVIVTCKVRGGMSDKARRARRAHRARKAAAARDRRNQLRWRGEGKHPRWR